MKKLILIRHSFAESGSLAPSDYKRNLTVVGEKVAQNQAKLLLKKNLIPDLIITSTATRAIQTTNKFDTILNPTNGVKTVKFLYEDYTTLEFFNMLNAIEESITTAAIIGHNPTIAAMASRLDTDSYNGFEPCSMAVFSGFKQWATVQVGDAKILEYFSS